MLSLRSFFDIRPGERAKTVFMSGYFFLTIALVYILKPIRNSLFLEEMGAENLRYAYIAEGFFLVLVVAAYIQLTRLIPKKVFFPAILVFFAANLGVFWLLLKWKVPYTSAFFYVWVDSFTITITTQFWLLANGIFSTEQAKRLFGVIISWGSLGGIAGSFLTSRAVRFMPTEDLLLITAIVVGLCVALTLATEAMEFKNSYDDFTSGHADPEAPDSGDSVFKIFLTHPYFVYLTLLVILVKIVSTIVDNQFTAAVEIVISGKEARTAFFASFMGWLNVVSFGMQLFATGPLLRRFGINSLWILPFGATLLCLGGWMYPLFSVFLAFRIFDGSVNYSIQQASKEMLFLPIPGALRPRVKPVIDMLGFRMAKAFAGMYIAGASALFRVENQNVGNLILGIIPVWILVLIGIKKEYSKIPPHPVQSSLHQSGTPSQS